MVLWFGLNGPHKAVFRISWLTVLTDQYHRDGAQALFKDRPLKRISNKGGMYTMINYSIV
jgi:hypothetical protein